MTRHGSESPATVAAPPLDSAGRSGRPGLLFLCHALPFPPDDGVQVRAYNLLRLLAERFDVTALCFYRRSARPDEEAVRAAVRGLSALADVSVFAIDQDESRIRFVWDHVRSVLRGRPYTQYVYRNAAFRERLEAVLADRRIDVVHVDSLDLIDALDALDGLPVVLGHHNIESELLLRRARQERSAVRRRYFRFQARLLRRAERRWCSHAALNVVVSAAERTILRGIAPGAHVRVAANGVDTRNVQRFDGPGRGILFMGGYGWAPNREGMRHFCESILPAIRRRRPDVEVTWIGRVPDAVRSEYAERYGITVAGYVDDINDYLRQAACCIVPIRVGSGTRVKILDAWAAGRPVVSTSIGCEGLAAADDRNILTRDEPEAFAHAVCALLEDPALAARIGRAGRDTAEREYDWTTIGEAIVPEYLRLAGVRMSTAEIS